MQTLLPTDQSREFARAAVETWENRMQILHADVFGENVAQHGAKIRRERKVAPFIELRASGPNCNVIIAP